MNGRDAADGLQTIRGARAWCRRTGAASAMDVPISHNTSEPAAAITNLNVNERRMQGRIKERKRV